MGYYELNAAYQVCKTMIKRILLSLFACLIIAASSLNAADDISSRIPDLGQPENRYFSQNLQALYGKLIYNEFYSNSAFVKNPIVDDYINNLGLNLFAHVTDSRYIPRFFVLKENRINAFAYPGGTIGVHTGLILASQTESELAGVVAHEISHVSQNHIARSIQNSAKQAPLQLLSALAIIAAASAGADAQAVAGTMQITQGLLAQDSVNFTRSQETEADQVGIKLMEKSGFSVTGFRDFFNRLAKSRGTDSLFPIPEMIQSHPKPSTRIAETNSRMTPENSRAVPNSLNYEMVKSLVADEHRLDDVLYRNLSDTFSESGREFDKAVKLSSTDLNASIEVLKNLNKKEFNPDIHLQQAIFQLRNGESSSALKTVDNALRLFPKNTLLTIFRAERLVEKNQLSLAIEELSQQALISNHPKIHEILATAYTKQGNKIEAYFHISEHYYGIGNYYQALYQLDNALASPDIKDEQARRMQSRYNQIYNELPESLREQLIRSNRYPNRRG